MGAYRELALGVVLEALGVALVEGDDGDGDARRRGRQGGEAEWGGGDGAAKGEAREEVGGGVGGGRHCRGGELLAPGSGPWQSTVYSPRYPDFIFPFLRFFSPTVFYLTGFSPNSLLYHTTRPSS